MLMKAKHKCFTISEGFGKNAMNAESLRKHGGKIQELQDLQYKTGDVVAVEVHS